VTGAAVGAVAETPNMKQLDAGINSSQGRHTRNWGKQS